MNQTIASFSAMISSSRDNSEVIVDLHHTSSFEMSLVPNGSSCKRIVEHSEESENLVCKQVSFIKFRYQYLIVFTAIMLADGLQGKHYISSSDLDVMINCA